MKAKVNVNKNFEEVCKQLEEDARSAMGVRLVKRKVDKEIIYHPNAGFWGIEDALDEVTVTVRKINNTTTHICIEFHEKRARIQNDIVRHSIASKAFTIFTKILDI